MWLIQICEIDNSENSIDRAVRYEPYAISLNKPIVSDENMQGGGWPYDYGPYKKFLVMELPDWESINKE